MPPEVGTFEAFYASPLQHPVLLWLAVAIALGVVLTRDGLAPSTKKLCIGLAVLSGLDAWLTTHSIFGLGPLQGWLVSVVPLFFVLAGDFRYWLLVCIADARGALAPNLQDVARALGLTLIVPIAASFGVNMVHLGIIFLTNLEIGYSTPPVGINLFIASSRFSEPVVKLYRATLPFLGLRLAGLLLITYFPALSLFLLHLFEK